MCLGMNLDAGLDSQDCSGMKMIENMAFGESSVLYR